MKIILASKSPRRKELFKYITDNFIAVESKTNETYSDNLTPNEIVTYLSMKKAKAVCNNYPDDIIIACDTIVAIDGKILEKPRDYDDAFQMLKTLSNKSHQVITGVTIIYQDYQESFYSTTEVIFYELSDEEIKKYLSTNEAFDKAGAYAIQGYASRFVKRINGDFFTVVGLPIGEIYQRLKKYLRTFKS